MKIIISEKPSQSQAVKQSISSLLGTEDVYYICVNAIGGFLFDYTNKKTKNPLYKKAEYHPAYIRINSVINGTDQTESFEEKDYIKNVNSIIKNADEVIIAVDPDYTGIRGVILSFKLLFNIDLKKIKVSFMTMYGHDLDGIQKAFRTRSDFNKSKNIEYLKTMYKKKDYLSYNFNVRSQIIFNEYKFSNILTRNCFALLILIHKNKELNKYSDINQLLSLMDKYAIGSVVSRHEIIKLLINNKLIEESCVINSNEKMIILTELGNDIISKIPDNFKNELSPSLSYIFSDYIQNKSISLAEFKRRSDEYIEFFLNSFDK
jgi:DNA topoisomerase IA